MLELLLGYLIKINDDNVSLIKTIELESGNVLMIGNRLNENSIGEIAILKFSNGGNILLSKSIYSDNSYLISYDAVYKNGKVYIIGTIDIENEGNNILFVVVDTSVNLITSNYFSIPNYENPSAANSINDRIYVVGTSAPAGLIKPFFLIIDTLGIPEIMKLGFLMPSTMKLKGLFIEDNELYVFGDYFENKRKSIILKFDSLFNFIEGKEIYDTILNLTTYGFSKKGDSLFILFNKFLLKFRSDWKVLNTKGLSSLLPRFLNYSNELEIFGLYNNKPFYYTIGYFPILNYVNIKANDLKYADEFVIFNSTSDYVFYKNTTGCDTIKSQMFNLSDTIVDVKIKNYQANFQTFSIPYSSVNLSIKDITISLSYICPSSNYKEFEVSKDKFYDVYKLDGTYLGKFKVNQLNKGIYILKDGKKFNKFLKLHTP